MVMADADKIFFNKIITGDETWCFACDPRNKVTDSEWACGTSSGPKKLKFQSSRIKTTLIIFFDSQDVVHKEFVPEGKTVNAEFYRGAMDRLLKRIRRVRSAAFCCRDFFLLNDSAPAHKAPSVCQFFTQKVLQPFITPRTPQIYLCQTIFCSPS